MMRRLFFGDGVTQTTAPDFLVALPAGPRPLAWLTALRGDGVVQQGAPTELAQKVQREACDDPSLVTTLCGVVPAEVVRIECVRVSHEQRPRIDPALPYLVEDHLASDLGEVHIARGDFHDGIVPCAVVDHRLMEKWLSVLPDGGLHCRQLVIDALLLPWEPGQVTVLIDGSRALVRWGRWHAAGVATSVLPVLLATLPPSDGALADQSLSLRWMETDDVTSTLPLHDGSVQAVHPWREIHREVLSVPLLAFWGGQLNGARGLINLRQGRYAPPVSKRFTAWHQVAAGLALLMVLDALAHGVTGAYWQREAEGLREQTEQTYRASFPRDRPGRNLRQQLDAQLRKVTDSANSAFFARFGDLTAALAADTSEQRPHLQALAFDNHAGTLRLELMADTTEALQQLESQLRQAGHAARLTSVSNRSNSAAATTAMSVQGTLIMEGTP